LSELSVWEAYTRSDGTSVGVAVGTADGPRVGVGVKRFSWSSHQLGGRMDGLGAFELADDGGT
jgi:hypothetical protein